MRSSTSSSSSFVLASLLLISSSSSFVLASLLLISHCASSSASYNLSSILAQVVQVVIDAGEKVLVGSMLSPLIERGQVL